MSRPSARTIAIRDQILAALRTEWPLPISTRGVCELLGASRYDETGCRIYLQLCALDRMGLIERIHREADCREVFWRSLGDPTDADLNAAVDAMESSVSGTVDRQHKSADEPTDQFEAILSTLDGYVKALDMAEKRFVKAAAAGNGEAEIEAADELAALVRQFVDRWGGCDGEG
jgi:hypothetical protein